VRECGDLVAITATGARRLALIAAALGAAYFPLVTAAQVPLARVASAATVSGTVFDSIAHAPLKAATVQLVNADSVSAKARTVETDTLGAFQFDGVRPGRYLVGFIHPLLDSIGVEQTPRAVTFDSLTGAVRVDLALPSPQSMRRVLCGLSAVTDSEALIIGIVRDAGTRSAVASSTVSVQWSELTFASGTLTRGTARRNSETPETGWFALCGAPVSGTVLLSAVHGADTTEALELEIPADGFLRRDLYFGASREMVTGTIASDTAAKVARRVAGNVADSISGVAVSARTGDGRVTGVIVDANGGRPLPGARVGIRNGPQVRADELGAFTLSGVPTGTRMLDVRAVAYEPLALPVDVVEGTAPLRIALVTVKSVLDTVKVRADLVADRNLQGFMRRKRYGGAGRFMSEDDIAKRNPVAVVDIFRSMPGIMIARDSDYKEILVQRSMTNFYNPFCRVAVYVNGISLTDPNVDMLNSYLRPSELLGIELYHGGSAPSEFSKRNGCGSLVIWLR
jgi:hypothetical protein